MIIRNLNLKVMCMIKILNLFVKKEPFLNLLIVVSIHIQPNLIKPISGPVDKANKI